MFTTPGVAPWAMSRKVSSVGGPSGRAGIAAAAAGSAERARAGWGRIWVVTTAPRSMAAMATEKKEAIVRVRVFIEPAPSSVPARRSAPRAR